MLIVEIEGNASLLSETVLSYLFSYAIKQVIWKQKFARNKFHIREIVATVAKKKKSYFSYGNGWFQDGFKCCKMLLTQERRWFCFIWFLK